MMTHTTLHLIAGLGLYIQAFIKPAAYNRRLLENLT